MRPIPLLFALLLTGCASSGGTLTGGGSTAPSPSASALPADRVVFQIEDCCGYAPRQWAVANRPALTIYGDGRAFVTADAEGAAARVLRQGVVEPSRLAELVAEAESSGLFDGVDFGSPGITDVGTTTVVLHTDGAPRKASAYALGYDVDSGLTPQNKRDRADLGALVDDLTGAPTSLHDYEPPEVGVVEVTDTWGRGEQPPAWPGPAPSTFLHDRSSGGRCGELSGADAAEVYAAALSNRTGTWTIGGDVTSLVVRPLLPGEEACPV